MIGWLINWWRHVYLVDKDHSKPGNKKNLDWKSIKGEPMEQRHIFDEVKARLDVVKDHVEEEGILKERVKHGCEFTAGSVVPESTNLRERNIMQGEVREERCTPMLVPDNEAINLHC